MKKDIGIFRVAVGAVIINEKNEVLITQRSYKRDHHPGEWETMTGRLAENEGFIEALHREAREELNIEVEPLMPLRTFHSFRGIEKVEHVGVTYLCRYVKGDLKVDGIEEIDAKWVNIDEAIKVIQDESIKMDFIIAKKFIH